MAARITFTIDNGLLAGTEYVFGEPGTCVIGRADDCDIRLPNLPGYQDVSRHHCLLDFDPPHVRVRDLGSRNGTRVNGMQIGRPYTGWEDMPLAFIPSYPLKDGDEIQVGGTVFRVSGAVAAEGPPAPAAGADAGPEAPSEAPVRVRGKRGGNPVQTFWPRHLTLEATTAADLMTPDVVSIKEGATIPEAVALLTEKGLGAVPVMGEDGRPVGVLSRTDIVAYDCGEYGSGGAEPEPDITWDGKQSRVISVEEVGTPLVRDIMTEVVFSVAPETPAATVIDAMLTLGVHRLYVTGPEGEVRGVVSTTDVLRHLHLSAAPFAGEPLPTS
jgi:CBS domain-containing protein